jgi:hypothetical protein
MILDLNGLIPKNRSTPPDTPTDSMKLIVPFLALLTLWSAAAQAATVFIEAETFHSNGGWEVVSGSETKAASGLSALSGARGAPDGVAAATVSIKDAGHYRVWVRYTSHPSRRAPFHVTALSGARELGDGLFDAAFEGKSARNQETWNYFETDLPEGEVTLRLSKHDHQNSAGASRLVDCLLLTMDDKLVPNHLNYGAKTWVRVRLGDCGPRPFYLHVFADHYHAPWYQHYSLGRSGTVAGTAPKKDDLLSSGGQTPWCDLTPMIYQDSGTMLRITARHTYTEQAERLRADIEFATAPEDSAIVSTMHVDFQPSGFSIFLPPNLLTPENRALLKTSNQIADATGVLADAHVWPTFGRKPERFPFFVSATMEHGQFAVNAGLLAREQKTLDYFGFTAPAHRHIGGAWLMQNGSYCQPDIEKMEARVRDAAAKFQQEGGTLKDIVFAELTDEPTGQPLDRVVSDPAYRDHFRAWLRGLGQTPERLLVKDWEAVRIVTETERDEFPALYYFSQRFRTRALGDFMATQRKLLEQAYGGAFPVLANFSDGAVYNANFYHQGVDYFELLDSPEQNAIWGEDWSNGASTYQCASFNVDLMRAAARDRAQVIGHHLIAYASRKPWDVQLKAASELGRGVKIMNNFYYGPSWASHEGGPYWRSHAWYALPETWTANASIIREVGAVEDMLCTAMPAPAKVALLYSSSTDAWTIGRNLAYGFDRMHTWIALAHAQVPVDIVSERQATDGELSRYTVCYLSGPNLTRAAAQQLRTWVQHGGTLWLTAGAAVRDEFNRPLDLLDDILPATRGEIVEWQKQAGSGRTLRTLTPKDEVRWPGGAASVLSLKQSLSPHPGATVLAQFRDGSPAVVRQGHVYCAGFLPALDYIKRALDARFALEEKRAADAKTITPEEATLLDRSANPWEFPEANRDLLLTPVREAGVVKPIECDTPLVDAVYMLHADGVLIPLANYTNQPRPRLSLRVTVPQSVTRAESAIHGAIDFRKVSPQQVELSLPLEASDFVKLYFK